MPQVGIELVDIDDFSCCGDPIQFKSADHLTWLSVAARNICLAEEQGLGILTLCNGCVNTLATVDHTLKDDRIVREDVNEVLANTGHQYKGSTEIKHFLQVIVDDIGVENLRSHVKTPLNGLKVATHTGCHLTSPDEILGFDNPLDPQVLDSLVAVLGAEPVDYDLKSLCCGVGFMLSGGTTESSNLLKDKLENMTRYEAQCIVTGCPFCFQQFDMGQVLASRKHKLDYTLPVMYFLQILGLALGQDIGEIRYDAHRAKSKDFESTLV